MKTSLVLSAFLALCTSTLSQTNVKGVPQPPSAELQKFESFSGKYEVSGDYANLPWTGTLELKKAIKTWYVEPIIQVNLPGIDREFRVLTPLDSSAIHDMPTDSAESELRNLMAERRKASVEGDTAKIAASMTEDYVQTDISGYRQDKTTWLKEYFKPLADLIKAGKFHWQEYEQKHLQFRFYGDCAIVTGELRLKGTGARPGANHSWIGDPAASLSATLVFTHVYVRQNGKWLLAALHNQLPLPTNPSK